MRVERHVQISLIVVDRFPMGPLSLRYAKELEGGAEFPATKVARRRDGRFDIRDGRHRLLAHKLAGRRTILCRYSDERLHGIEK